VRLDSLLKELDVSRLDLMKIDAEGAENLIFNGGEEIFRKYRPDVICEFLDGSQPAEIESMLTSMGYRYFHIDDQAMRVDPVERITVGKNKHSLNTLITCKSNEKVASMLAS
jgi:hypothetical protein